MYKYMLLPFSIRIADNHLFENELFIRLNERAFRGRWSNFVYVLLSLLVLRWDVGCDCINS